MILIDSPVLARVGVGLLLDRRQELLVLGEAGTAREGLQLVRDASATNLVALVGLELPGRPDAFSLIRSLRERHPQIRILGFAHRPDDFLLSRALFVGADGFVDKDSRPDELIDAILRTAAGEVVLVGVPDDALGRIADGIERHGDSRILLTDREIQVLSEASHGLTARQIGRNLGVHERTVTTHLGRIYKKLGAGGRVAALRRAREHGLVLTHSR